MLTLDMLKLMAGCLISAGSVYGAIRADLRSMRESVTRAHDRIDRHIENHK
ncbi:hypothetical protein KKP06_21960 [Ralstonia pickettii]|uniref:hypothetical protein n=1 Tax=Ralstonia pickettii TaxID=329 RepID=UPI001BE3E01D|nr:hypothetical protein [Ralstonia pickettii]MBT2180484.1 hypothetical protein [Ralstonia pickettii]